MTDLRAALDAHEFRWSLYLAGCKCGNWSVQALDAGIGHRAWADHREAAVRAALAAAEPASLRDALEIALRTIHGSAVPLPNRPSPREYAEMIVRWMPATPLAWPSPDDEAAVEALARPIHTHQYVFPDRCTCGAWEWTDGIAKRQWSEHAARAILAALAPDAEAGS